MSSLHQTPPNAITDAARRFQLADDILHIPIPDGSVRLIDLHGDFFALSHTSAMMLDDVLNLGPAQAADATADRWGIDRVRAENDMNVFVADLVERNLLVLAGGRRRTIGLGRAIAAIFLRILLFINRRLRPTFKGRVSGMLTAAKLSCRWLGWANTVVMWKRVFALPPRMLQGGRAEETRDRIDQTLRLAIADSAFAHACKERGLTGWALARSRGLEARLMIGLSLCPVHGHCWAESAGRLLGDTEEQCGQYQPVQSYV